MKTTNLLFPACDFRDLGRAIQRNLPPAPKPAAPTIEDDRTPKQRDTHHAAIVATDPGMSGWGKAEGGMSLCVWACAPDVNPESVLRWVEARSDMSDAALVDLCEWEAPEGTAHVHIYTCNQGHPATI